MKHRGKTIQPIWVAVVADVLVYAVLLCTFCYFHHIRILWGEQGSTETPVYPFEENGTGLEYENPEAGFLAENDVYSDSTSYRSDEIAIKLTEVNTVLNYGGKNYTVQYYVYDIYIYRLQNLYCTYSASRRDFMQLVHDSAKLTDSSGNFFTDGICIAAINDDYWGNANHTLVAVRNGKVLRSSSFILSDICVLYYDGTMEIYTPDTYNWDAILARKPYQVWDFGPSLLSAEGKALSVFDNDAYDSHVISQRNPRTAIGYYEPGHYCFVVVDGRSTDSQGVRMFQLADIMQELGCSAAYNLDGGGSSLAYFNGEMVREVEGVESQRAMYGIICIGEIN